jgi:hypothetical protein
MPFIRAIGTKGKHDASCRALATRKLARCVHVQRAWYPLYIEAGMLVLFAKLQTDPLAVRTGVLLARRV